MYHDYDHESSYLRANRATQWEESQQKGIVHSEDEDVGGDESFSVQVAMVCIYRKKDAASMFDELVPKYISDHVL